MIIPIPIDGRITIPSEIFILFYLFKKKEIPRKAFTVQKIIQRVKASKNPQKDRKSNVKRIRSPRIHRKEENPSKTYKESKSPQKGRKFKNSRSQTPCFRIRKVVSSLKQIPSFIVFSLLCDVNVTLLSYQPSFFYYFGAFTET